jgi:glycine cleavage system transcriptional repressor
VTERAVLTAIGQDRPGLVEEVSEFVFARGGSIEHSRMANLYGQFAIAMSVAGPADAIARIAAELDALAGKTGIHAQLTPAVRPAGGSAAGSRVPFRLTGRALDQAGLVHQVANVLRSLGVNIESMETTLEAAPETGAPLFAMELLLAAPSDLPAERLEGELGRVCEPLNIDWKLEPG